MSVTYTLGKDYTVSGLAGVSELTVTRESERVDVTTRANTKPVKMTDASFAATTIECSVFAEQNTKFSVGKKYAITLDGSVINAICMTVAREEPQAGVVTYNLTFKPGVEAASGDQIEVAGTSGG